LPRKRPDRPPPTFFLDRGLGRVHVAGAIRSAGFDVVLMADVFESDGQYVGDDEWISLASDRGWIALTKDVSITRAHTDALRASTLRTFALPNAHLTGVEMAARFEVNLHRIIQRSRKPGPFVDVVFAGRIERRWPLT
jgi:hypothetical protein